MRMRGTIERDNTREVRMSLWIRSWSALVIQNLRGWGYSWDLAGQGQMEIRTGSQGSIAEREPIRARFTVALRSRHRTISLRPGEVRPDGTVW